VTAPGSKTQSEKGDVQLERLLGPRKSRKPQFGLADKTALARVEGVEVGGGFGTGRKTRGRMERDHLRWWRSKETRFGGGKKSQNGGKKPCERSKAEGGKKKGQALLSPGGTVECQIVAAAPLKNKTPEMGGDHVGLKADHEKGRTWALGQGERLPIHRKDEKSTMRGGSGPKKNRGVEGPAVYELPCGKGQGAGLNGT